MDASLWLHQVRIPYTSALARTESLARNLTESIDVQRGNKATSSSRYSVQRRFRADTNCVYTERDAQKGFPSSAPQGCLACPSSSSCEVVPTMSSVMTHLNRGNKMKHCPTWTGFTISGRAAALAATLLGLTLAAVTPAAAATGTITISGTVSCQSHSVVGVWVESGGGGSGWANWQIIDARHTNIATYQARFRTHPCPRTSAYMWAAAENHRIGGQTTELIALHGQVAHCPSPRPISTPYATRARLSHRLATTSAAGSAMPRRLPRGQ